MKKKMSPKTQKIIEDIIRNYKSEVGAINASIAHGKEVAKAFLGYINSIEASPIGIGLLNIFCDLDEEKEKDKIQIMMIYANIVNDHFLEKYDNKTAS